MFILLLDIIRKSKLKSLAVKACSKATISNILIANKAKASRLFLMKKAVILFNLGGPDNLENVKPFLHNLFSDPAIIRAPKLIRKFLAKFISSKRESTAQEIYSHIGGKSPILELTQAQAKALEDELGDGWKVFISMRYWHPMSDEVAKQVKEFAPDEIILLPLYPQYSTTTTDSSLLDWHRAAKNCGIDIKTRDICCYPTEPNFIQAHVDSLRSYVEGNPDARVLFSAHGLPEKVVKQGDPYPEQVKETSALVAGNLGIKDWKVCYQSKVGPLPWLKPNTEDEIKLAGKEGKDVILTPIAFVSEHSETLVELDIEFKEIADEYKVKNYMRVPALGDHPAFIKCLAKLCENERYSKQFCAAEESRCESLG